MTGGTNEDHRAARQRANLLRYAIEEYQARMEGWRRLDAEVFRFWAQGSRDWPRRNPGYVFLGEAVHKLGKAYFPDAWNGIEPMVSAPPEPPSPEVAAAIARSKALADILDPGGSPPQTQDKNEGMRLTDADRAAAADRFTHLKLFIANLAARGGLLTATRAIAGGEVRPMPASFWSTEQIDQRFRYCQINPANPFAPGFAGDGFQYIFVSEESLRTAIAGIDLAHRRARGEPDPEPQQSQSKAHKSGRGRPSARDMALKAAQALLAKVEDGSFSMPVKKIDFAREALAEAKKSPEAIAWMERRQTDTLMKAEISCRSPANLPNFGKGAPINSPINFPINYQRSR